MNKQAMKRWIGLVLAVAALLPAAFGGVEDSAAYEQVPGVRQPTLRRIQAQRDSATIERIETVRQRLPAQYRKRYNFAWVVAKVDGLDKTEYFAHSGIQSLDRLSSAEAKKLAGISVRPEKGRYKALCVNQNDIVDGPNCWVRTVDTEYKILEEIAAKLPDTSVKGRVKLYTDLPPCASCWNVMKQFMAEFTNVHVQVLFKQR